ncbi:MAG: M50 family metallopeptidase [Candidatus Dojkabacteria bacterium]
MTDVVNWIVTIIAFFFIISLLVFVHELGHFLTAKFFGVYVREFAIGFGKTIWSKKWKNTIYAIRLVPLGGFVELEGEVSSKEGPNAFRNKPAYQKILILVAGVAMNLIFATLLFALFLPGNGYRFSLPAVTDYNFSNTQEAVKAFPITVVSVNPDGPSAGQLNEGEVIIGIDGTRVVSYSNFQQILKDSQEKTVQFEFINMDTYKTTTRDIRVGKANDKGAILDVGLNFDRTLPYPVYLLNYNNNITAAASLTTDTSFFLFKSLGSLFGNAFQSGNYSEVAQSVGGLPTLANNVGQVVEVREFTFLIPLAALISISLAIFNILPFPALDGGQAFVVLLESLTRRKVPDSILSKINTFGFLFLIGLAILVNLKDVIQLGWLNNIGNFFKSIVGR